MAAEDDSDFSDVDLDTIRERAAIRAARREISALCHEMTAAVDLLVSPHLARQEIRALCRSMTEEVDASPDAQRAVVAELQQRVVRMELENAYLRSMLVERSRPARKS